MDLIVPSLVQTIWFVSFFFYSYASRHSLQFVFGTPHIKPQAQICIGECAEAFINPSRRPPCPFAVVQTQNERTSIPVLKYAAHEMRTPRTVDSIYNEEKRPRLLFVLWVFNCWCLHTSSLSAVFWMENLK